MTKILADLEKILKLNNDKRNQQKQNYISEFKSVVNSVKLANQTFDQENEKLFFKVLGQNEVLKNELSEDINLMNQRTEELNLMRDTLLQKGGEIRNRSNQIIIELARAEEEIMKQDDYYNKQDVLGKYNGEMEELFVANVDEVEPNDNRENVLLLDKITNFECM